MAKCAKGMQNNRFSKGQKLRHAPACEEKHASRRHHYGTLTNASTSPQRQGKHNRTQSLPGLPTLTPRHTTGWQWQ